MGTNQVLPMCRLTALANRHGAGDQGQGEREPALRRGRRTRAGDPLVIASLLRRVAVDAPIDECQTHHQRPSAG